MAGSKPMSFKTLSLEVEQGVAWLTLNRPERLNAINIPMVAELRAFFAMLNDDQTIRVVVLRGAGRHFSAGLDLDEMEAFTSGAGAAARAQRNASDLVLAMRRCPQPIIALMHGAAAGAGFALALAADVRYAAQGARMNAAMAKIGLSGSDMGISYFLPRAVGTSNAAELMMGGRFADADKALRIGLVSEIVSPDQLDATGRRLAEEMVAMSPMGLRLTKEGLNASQDAGSLEAALAMEDRAQLLCIARYLEEGAAAFKEKRPANYDDL